MDFGDLKARVERLEEHHNDLEKAVVELNKARCSSSSNSRPID